MNTFSADNYINRRDALLGDLDRIRLRLEKETRGMSFEQEQDYFSNWQKEIKTKYKRVVENKKS